MNTVLGATLPSGWRVAPLKHVFSLIDRGTAPSYSQEGSVRAISQAANQANGLDWTRTRFHDHKGDPRRLRGYLRPGDVLVNSTGTGTLGRVGYFTGPPDDKPCIADGHVTVLRTQAALVESRFAYYWLKSKLFNEYMQSTLTVGATNQIELSREGLRSAPIALPPAPLQRQIIKFLDSATLHISVLDDLRVRHLHLLQERLQKALDELFDDQQTTTETRVKYLLRMRPRYGVLVPEFVDEGVPFIRVNDLLDLEARAGSLRKIPAALSRQYARTVIEVGDLLVSVVGTLGRGTIAPPGLAGANVARAVASLRTLPQVDPRLLLAWFKTSSFERQAQIATSTDTAQPTLGMEDLSNFQLRWPSSGAAQQKMFGRIIELQEAFESLSVPIKAQRVRLAERRDSLITAAVTGQIDIFGEGQA